MPESITAGNPPRHSANRAWAVAMGLAFLAMIVLGVWIWKDLDRRIAVGKEHETKTGKNVGPDLLKSPRSATEAPPAAAS